MAALEGEAAQLFVAHDTFRTFFYNQIGSNLAGPACPQEQDRVAELEGEAAAVQAAREAAEATAAEAQRAAEQLQARLDEVGESFRAAGQLLFLTNATSRDDLLQRNNCDD